MIGILIVNYNNISITKECIKSLQSQGNKKFEIYLVDQNSSEEGTDLFIKECLSEKIKVIKNNRNIPLNHVWNNFNRICEHEYLCFLNNDIIVTNNFVDDTIKILDDNNNVGIVIHVTNNLDYCTESDLNYKILEEPLFQGWDFTIRKNILPLIPEELKIFAGDDYIFAKIHKQGYKIALAFSSPIIHYKEQTRKMISNIDQIQKSDASFFEKIIIKENLNKIGQTITSGYCNRYPPANIKLINK